MTSEMNILANSLNILGIFYRFSPQSEEFQSITHFFSTPDWQQQWLPLENAHSFNELSELHSLSIEDWKRSFSIDLPLDAPPWGSVYTDVEQVLHGKTTQEYTEYLTFIGLDINTSEKEPLDHVGLIFFVLSYLADTKHEDDLLTAYSLHLKPWLSQYLSALRKTKVNTLIELMIQLTEATMQVLDSCFPEDNADLSYPIS